jgi:hypothetical protein
MKKIGILLIVLFTVLFSTPTFACEDGQVCPGEIIVNPPPNCSGPDCEALNTGGWIIGNTGQLQDFDTLTKGFEAGMDQCFSTAGKAGPGFTGSWTGDQTQIMARDVNLAETNWTADEFFAGMEDGIVSADVSPDCTPLHLTAGQGLNAQSAFGHTPNSMNGVTSVATNAFVGGVGNNPYASLTQEAMGGYDQQWKLDDNNYSRQMDSFKISTTLTAGTPPTTPAP